MKIVFDMDNTIADELGGEVRPGIRALLDRLVSEGYELAIWTHSTRARAKGILRQHGLEDYFSTFVFREDYDPENRNLPKDIRTIDGDFLVDDDPDHVAHMQRIDRKGFVVSSYRGGYRADPDEIQALYAAIRARRRSLKLAAVFGR